MEACPEKVPATMTNRQFPMGDIDYSHKADMIDQWYEDKETYEQQRLGNYVGQRGFAGNENTRVANNHEAAVKLCKHWDRQVGDSQYALIGYMVTRMFTNDIPSILPAFDIDISSDIKEMASKEQPIDARTFGKFAWAGMQYSHPSVSMQFERLFEMVERRLGLYEDTKKEQFIGGMMLPYVMSAITNMERYYISANVRGVKVGTVEELESMDFSLIFVSEK